MTTQEVRDAIKTQFALVSALPDLDVVQRLHVASVRGWANILAPRIAAAHTDMTAVPVADIIALVFDLLKLVFVANPVILAIVTMVEGLLVLAGL